MVLLERRTRYFQLCLQRHRRLWRLESQLTVYKASADTTVSRVGGGHNGSNNFAVHFGYATIPATALVRTHCPP